MMAPQQELRSQRRKRKRTFEATAELESQPQQPPTNRQRQSYSARSKTPPEFWDKLSRVPLCRRALREFNRRAIRPTAPQLHAMRDIENSQVKQLQRFARRGGPDLRSIRGYPEQETQAKMSPKRSRSNQPNTLRPIVKRTTLSSKDPAFEQELIDNGIYPPGHDEIEPDNLEEIVKKLRQPRASLSSSNFSRDEFLRFRRKHHEATSEAEIVNQVFPMITGETNIPCGYNQLFNNLKPLSDHISKAQPDYFNGSSTAEIRPKVRDDLERYIIPSSQRHRPALPNFFMEAKGPEGKPSVARRQITQNLAIGARGMLRMQSYGLDDPVFDNKAYTFGSTYQDGQLQLYAMHPTKLGDADGKPQYHTTKIRGFDMTDNLDTHRGGIEAFRNLRDLAKERRVEFIASANKTADNDDEPEYHTTQIGAYALTGNVDACRQGIGAFRNLRDLAKEKRAEFIASANKTADNNDEPEVALVDTDLTSSISASQSKLFTADSDHEELDSTSADEPAILALPKKRTKARQLGNKKQKKQKKENK